MQCRRHETGLGGRTDVIYLPVPAQTRAGPPGAVEPLGKSGRMAQNPTVQEDDADGSLGQGKRASPQSFGLGWCTALLARGWLST